MRQKIKFDKIRYAINLSQHSINRMKKRAGLNTREKRKSFLKGVAKSGLLLSEIPKIEQFDSFLGYMGRIVHKTRRKSKYCRVYLYKKYFLIVSMYGLVITILKIDEEFNTVFEQIHEYIDTHFSEEEQEECIEE